MNQYGIETLHLLCLSDEFLTEPKIVIASPSDGEAFDFNNNSTIEIKNLGNNLKPENSKEEIINFDKKLEIVHSIFSLKAKIEKL